MIHVQMTKAMIPSELKDALAPTGIKHESPNSSFSVVDIAGDTPIWEDMTDIYNGDHIAMQERIEAVFYAEQDAAVTKKKEPRRASKSKVVAKPKLAPFVSGSDGSSLAGYT